MDQGGLLTMQVFLIAPFSSILTPTVLSFTAGAGGFADEE
jgi:hypothetical protein